MKRNCLTAAFVKSVTKPGKFQDGIGLQLIVRPTGGKFFTQRLTVHGKRRELGIGSYPDMTLAEARDKALSNRRTAKGGQDPAAARNVPSFADALEAVIVLNRPTWKGDASEAQWRQELGKYVLPTLGAAKVDAIGTADVLAVILPHWNTTTATMQRVRGRLKVVFDWCIASGYRTDNPAGEAVTAILPKSKSATVHRQALAYADVGAALRAIRGNNRQFATVGLCLTFIALTAARSGEATGATWSEIDETAAAWTVPAARMKAGREHCVPLSAPALAVLEEARRYADKSGLVFPSATGRRLAGGVLSRTMKPHGATVHGLRSSFADWCAEQSDADRETVERSLAHLNKNAVEAAYRRTTQFEKRQKLMQAWADYLAK